MIVTIVAISFLIGCQDKPKSLLLTSNEPNQSVNALQHGILFRELFRQALLIAARDGMNIGTRDMTLRETDPQDTDHAARSIAMDTRAENSEQVEIQIKQNAHKVTEAVWQRTIPFKGEESDYVNAIQLAEKLSRKDFIEALEKTGFSGSQNTHTPNLLLSPETEKNLNAMSLISQFAALREIQAMIRKRGESPFTLAGLVRAYAHLAKLTDYSWNATDKVFMARSLLYAEHMVAHEPDSCWALWHRAYARAFAGFHAAALADLDAAKKLSTARETALRSVNPDETKTPVWVNIIDAYCRFDYNSLASLAAQDKSNEELALFLRFLVLERSKAENLILEAGRRVLEINPASYRVINGLCYVEQISHLHWVTQYGPAMLAEDLPGKLKMMPGLPEEVAALIKSLEKEAAPQKPCSAASAAATAGRGCSIVDPFTYYKTSRIASALVTVDCNKNSAEEPSWSLLGRMIQELLFTQARHRAYFMRYQWAVPMDDFLKQTIPLLDNHPYRAFIESYNIDPRNNREAYTNLLKNVTVVDASLTMWPLLQAMNYILPRENRKNNYITAAISHSDNTADDLESIIAYYYSLTNTMPGGPTGELVQYAARLQKVSPYSPVGLAVRINYDWQAVEMQVAACKSMREQYPLLIDALTNHYIQSKEYEKAVQCLQLYVEMYPDKKHYQGLAEFYKYQGKMDDWLRTLEDFLKHEDTGLAGDKVRVEIADYYMAQKQWEKALPYAEKAAQSYAGWAMLCASQCNEGLLHWEKAEQWIRNISERYDDNRLYWYIWCKRTGHGNLDAARQFFAESLQKSSGQQKIADVESAGIYYILENQPEKALPLFQQAFSKTSGSYYGLHVAVLAELLNEKETRDDALKLITEKSGRSRQDMPLQVFMPVVSLLRQISEKNAPDPMYVMAIVKAFDEVINLAPAGTNTDLAYFVGCFLEHQGYKDEGVEYIKRGATSSDLYRYNTALAGNFLRSHGIKF